MDVQDEFNKWAADWSTRENDVSGWRHVLAMADRCGADTSKYRTAAAVAEFESVALPPEPDAPVAPVAVRTVINVRPDNLTDQVNAAEAALMSADFGLYQRAGAIVRVGKTVERSRTGGKRSLYRMAQVDEPHLRELIELCCDFYRWDARTKEEVRTRCAPDLPRTYVSRGTLGWRLPHLAGIISAPTLRHDGSVLQASGFDDASGLFLDNLCGWSQISAKHCWP